MALLIESKSAIKRQVPRAQKLGSFYSGVPLRSLRALPITTYHLDP